jgi:drug/metabolite transporter (DMT)-like permease
VLLVAALVMLPFLLLKRRAEAVREWRANWRSILVVGVLVMGGYLVILFALQNNPVSYATSVRGVSVVFGAIMGMTLLKEAFTRQKLLGALVIFAGIACIGFG